VSFIKLNKNKKIFLVLTLILVGCFCFGEYSLAKEASMLKDFSRGAGMVGSLLFSGILATMYGIYKLVLILLAGSMWLLNVMISPKMFDAVFFSPVAIKSINAGWEFVRDFFNLFFILILILVGLSTILGVSKFKDKTIIIRVAFAAMLINFSKPITLFFIDMSQVFMRYFANLIEKNDFASAMQSMLNFESVIAFKSLSDNFVFFVAILMAIIMVLIMTVMLFYLAISLIVRMIAFWVLIILSPMAMFGIAMEGTKLGSLKDDWTKNLISWCFYGPVLLFFMYLSIILISAISEATAEGFNQVQTLNPEQLKTNAGGESNMIIDLCKMLIPFITAIYLLFYGYDKAKSLSTGAASKILDAGNKKLSQINRVVKKGGYGAAYVFPKTTKGIQEGIKAKMENSPTFSRFTKKGKQETQEKINAKWKRKITGDDSAEKELERKKIYENQKELKNDNTSEGKLKTMLANESLDKNKRRAAALLLSENNQLDSVENYTKANELLEDHLNLQEKIRKETKKENLGAFIGHELKTRQGEKDANGRQLTENEIRKKVFDENLNGNLNTIFKNQNKTLYEQHGVVDHLYGKHQNKDILTRRKFADNIKNSEIEEELGNSEKGEFLMGLSNNRNL